MTDRSEIFRTRTILPVALGIAIGVVLGAAALASAPASLATSGEKALSPARPNAAILLPLSAQPGIRFVRNPADTGDLCLATRANAEQSPVTCVH